MLWRALHARGDTYLRGEGHITPDTLVSLLLWRYSPLQDHATGESASVATRQRGCGGAEMRALAHTQPQLRHVTHVAPHSSKAPGLIKLMPFSERSNSPVNSGHEPVRTSGAPAHTPDALSQCSAVHASRSAWHQS